MEFKYIYESSFYHHDRRLLIVNMKSRYSKCILRYYKINFPITENTEFVIIKLSFKNNRVVWMVKCNSKKGVQYQTEFNDSEMVLFNQHIKTHEKK